MEIQLGRIVAGNVHARFQNQRFVHNGRVFYNNRVFFNNRFAYRANFFRYNTRWAWHPGFCWRHPLYCRTQLGVYHYGVAPVYQPAPVIAAPVVAPFGRCLRQIRLADGSSLLDLFGDGFTLLRLGEQPPDAGPLAQAAKARRVPLREIAIADPAVAALYERPLVLVRPDGHVAWRGDALPADPAGIVERMRGAAVPGTMQSRSALAVEEQR